jgi:hypothetical protein
MVLVMYSQIAFAMKSSRDVGAAGVPSASVRTEFDQTAAAMLDVLTLSASGFHTPRLLPLSPRQLSLRAGLNRYLDSSAIRYS